MDDIKDPAKTAAAKIASGCLLTIDEVAARLSCAPATVHRLPIPSIRIGRLLRFDPKDVEAFLEQSREAFVAFTELATLLPDPLVEVQQVWPTRPRFSDLSLQLAHFKCGMN